MWLCYISYWQARRRYVTLNSLNNILLPGCTTRTMTVTSPRRRWWRRSPEWGLWGRDRTIQTSSQMLKAFKIKFTPRRDCEEEAAKCMAEMDLDKDGRVSFAEFVIRWRISWHSTSNASKTKICFIRQDSALTFLPITVDFTSLSEYFIIHWIEENAYKVTQNPREPNYTWLNRCRKMQLLYQWISPHHLAWERRGR